MKAPDLTKALELGDVGPAVAVLAGDFEKRLRNGETLTFENWAMSFQVRCVEGLENVLVSGPNRAHFEWETARVARFAAKEVCNGEIALESVVPSTNRMAAALTRIRSLTSAALGMVSASSDVAGELREVLAAVSEGLGEATPATLPMSPPTYDVALRMVLGGLSKTRADILSHFAEDEHGKVGRALDAMVVAGAVALDGEKALHLRRYRLAVKGAVP